MDAQSIGTLVAIIGLTVSIVVFILQIRAQTRIQKVAYIAKLNDKYDEICRFRCDNPDIVELAASWEDKPLELQSADERKYYFYAGMTLGFFEIAIYSTFVTKILSLVDYRDFVRPMMLQEVAFNLKVFGWLSHKGFVTEKTRHVLQELVTEAKDCFSKGMLPGMLSVNEVYKREEA